MTILSKKWKIIHITIALCCISQSLTEAATKNVAMPARDIQVLPGFKAEIIASFPQEQTSIISLTVDDNGHLLASGQNDRLFRIIPGDLNQNPSITSIHNIPMNLGGAHGLLYTFEHLYIVKTDGDGERGVYRLKDTDGKGSFTDPELIIPVPGRGEHGAHGLVIGPALPKELQQKGHGDRWIYLIAGNGTGTPENLNHDLIPGIRKTESFEPPARQGWVMRFSPDGKIREMFCHGLRNAYDLAFNSQGDLFTFDSDNEGFMGLPWYRPANVYHLIDGADYGWRQSPENLMPYYPDTLPPTLEIGPGSPTGVIFGTGTHFPFKYQEAFYACDWSYGRIYAVHLEQDGATYHGKWEFFASGTPMAVTDIVVGHDGALYYSTGGRGNPSNIYRISHTEPTTVAKLAEPTRQSKLRKSLSALTGEHNLIDFSTLASSLKSDDRTIRYAARTVLEHQPLEIWSDQVFAQVDKTILLEGLTAFARHASPSQKLRAYEKLTSLNWDSLTEQQRLTSLRVFSILMERMGLPSEPTQAKIVEYLNPLYPDESNNINKELASLLSQFQPAGYTQRTLDSISEAESLMTQLHFLSILMDIGIHEFTESQKSQLTVAINPFELRAVAHRKYRAQSEELQTLIRTLELPKAEGNLPDLPVIRNWTLAELIPLTKPDSLKSADISKGKIAFRKVRCDNCHRIDNAGGVLGPNLNGLAGRFSPDIILEHILRPDKVISDQYQASTFVLKDGRQISGQIVNLSSGRYSVRTDPFRPFARTDLQVKDIEEVVPSKASLMPTGLLNVLTKDEIRDLLGYLISPR